MTLKLTKKEAKIFIPFSAPKLQNKIKNSVARRLKINKQTDKQIKRNKNQ